MVKFVFQALGVKPVANKIPKFLKRNLGGGGGLTESVGSTLGLNSSAARRLLRVRFCRQLNWPGFNLCVQFCGEL